MPDLSKEVGVLIDFEKALIFNDCNTVTAQTT